MAEDKPSPPPPSSEEIKSVVKDAAKDLSSQIPSPPSKDSTQEKILAYAQKRISASESHTAKASTLRQSAEHPSTSESKRDQLLQLASEHEDKSRKELKAVKRLESGALQGAGMGGGMGAGLGMGIGTVVGTVVGGVVSVPTTLVGGAVGAGTGAVHGPWFKIPGVKGMVKNREGKVAEEGQVEDEEVEEGKEAAKE